MISAANSGPESVHVREAGNIRKLALRGSIWVILGYGSAQILRFANNLALAYLLSPDAFGLMLLANVFLQGLYMFSDLGIGVSIIQNRRSDSDFLNTAWTVQIFRGILLWICSCAIALPYSVFYTKPVLLAMVPVTGLCAIFDGLSSTSIFTVNRKFMIGRLQLFEISVQCISTIITIAAALVWRSVWALVIGVLASSIARMAASHYLLPGPRNRFRLESEAFSSIFHFGKWIFVSSVLTFFAQQGDRLIFGKMIPTGMLGVYNIASSLCDLPTTLVSTISSKVFFPFFSEINRSSDDINPVYQRVCSAMLFLMGLIAIPLMILGPFLVSVLYDVRYIEAGWILQVLSIGILFTTLVQISGFVGIALGQTKWVAAANAARLLWLLSTVPLVHEIWGFQPAVFCVAMGDLARYGILAIGVRRHGLHIFQRDLVRMGIFGLSLAAGFLLSWCCGDLHRTLGLLSAVTASIGLWCLFNQGALQQSLGLIRKMVRRL